MKILVVDDEPDMLGTCLRLLERRGYACLAARSATDAIGLIDAELPALVVTDLNLHGADGLMVARHARRHSPPIPVILITAYASSRAQGDAYDAGATAYLPKPFSNEAFLDAVRLALI